MEDWPDGVDETRDYALGYSMTQRLLLVVHTERTSRYRLISARPATRKERNLYESE
ncbi:MAG: BrnT family toxin [Roseiflexaceae bacterium]|nr:BrnT family toxin [Roseiflexaceae bacterium]